MIKYSHGTTVRLAVIYFQGNMSRRATCSCPLGLRRVCCHILALLLYLKHYSDTKETCAQQVQKWYCRSKKDSIPMVPLNKIRPKSARMRIKRKQN